MDGVDPERAPDANSRLHVGLVFRQHAVDLLPILERGQAVDVGRPEVVVESGDGWNGAGERGMGQPLIAEQKEREEILFSGTLAEVSQEGQAPVPRAGQQGSQPPPESERDPLESVQPT